VADLIAYRQRKETLIEHIDSFEVETAAGPAKAFIPTSCPGTRCIIWPWLFGDIRDGVDVPVGCTWNRWSTTCFPSMTR
jgi:3,4-dihydroxy 2-butanone 4-phosphate synthase/GTP cyclohydrolase II